MLDPPAFGWHASIMAVDLKHVKPGIEVATLTDVGLQRTNNEDSFLYWEPDSDDQFQSIGRLAVVADGMGGYEGGQEASRLAVETIRDVYRTYAVSDPQQALVQGLATAHDNILNYATEHPDLTGMGTTCTAIGIVAHKLYFAHVGDSRLYLVRGTTSSRITRDHSYVGRLVESGIVRLEDAESHPQRHILTAALGSGNDLQPDFPDSPIQLEKGNALILCTDGLWSLVSEQELARTVHRRDPVQACEDLVKLALERGGPDNITVMILRVSA